MTLILICRSASLIVPMAELPCMRVLKSASQFDPTMWTLLAARRAATAARSTSAGDLFSRPLVAAVPLAGGAGRRCAAASGHVPQPHRAILAAGGQGRAVRAERHREDYVAVPGEGLADLAVGGRAPQPHRAIAAR